MPPNSPLAVAYSAIYDKEVNLGSIVKDIQIDLGPGHYTSKIVVVCEFSCEHPSRDLPPILDRPWVKSYKIEFYSQVMVEYIVEIPEQQLETYLGDDFAEDLRGDPQPLSLEDEFFSRENI